MTSRTSTASGSASPRWLDRGEGRIAYDVRGTGPLVVCVGGMGALRSSFRFNTGALAAAGFRVATMDLRGHGDSDATFSSYDDVAAAGDMAALIRHLGGPAIVIGNSMGGAVAVWVAVSDPALVAGLVLVDALVRPQPVSWLTVLGQRIALARPWARPAWASYLSKLYPGRRPDDYAEHRAEIVASMRRPGHTRAFLKTTKFSPAAVEKRLGEVAVPLLVVVGDRDPDFRDPASEARWIGERLGGETLLVPGAGHYPQAEYPEIVNPALVAFASRVFGRDARRSA
jgi:pimeloyl-ACP methyl ester carboxylesterase